MRRRDREVTGLQNILAILDRCDILRLGLCDEGRPYVVPLNFAYEAIDGIVKLYLHCAPEGRKLDILKKNHNVCFEVDCSYQTIQAEQACAWSANYESVIGEGTAAVLPDDAQKAHGLDLLMKRHGFEGRPQYSPHALAAVTVLCITVTNLTGKHHL